MTITPITKNITSRELSMSNLVSIVDGQPLTTSTAISEGVDRPHKNILEIIRSNLSDFEEFGPIAFETRKGEALPQGGFAKATEYALLNEHHATLLITFMRNIGVVKEFKKRLVKAFFEMRDQVHAIQTPASFSEALRLAADQAECIEQQKRELALVQPKAEFHDQVVISEDAISVAEAAKSIATGRNRLMAFMRQIGWISKRNEPYQSTIEQGLMNVKISKFQHPEQGLKESITPVITGKGLAKLQKLYRQRTAA